MLATLALSAVHDATCTNDAAHDTALLTKTINASAAGDLVRIHGNCLVRETICLRGDCAYVGDSRSGTSITQADGTNLAAVLASAARLCIGEAEQRFRDLVGRGWRCWQRVIGRSSDGSFEPLPQAF